MQLGRFSIGTQPRAPHATAVPRNSRSASQHAKTRCHESNRALVQRELRARGRHWFEGRIAECLRLQQKRPSS